MFDGSLNLFESLSRQGLGHSPEKRNYEACDRDKTRAAVFQLSAEVLSPALKPLSLQSEAIGLTWADSLSAIHSSRCSRELGST